MSNPTQEYNDYIRANLPPGITYDEVRARYVTANGKYFPTYLEAKWYLDYITKFGYDLGSDLVLPLFADGEQGAWYDPSDLTTLYQDAAGTTPVTADGDPVGYMADKSGNGNHATQSIAAARPVYRTDGTLHWLEGDGVDDFLTLPWIQTADKDWSGVFGAELFGGGSNPYLFGAEGDEGVQFALLDTTERERPSVITKGGGVGGNEEVFPFETPRVLSLEWTRSAGTLLFRRNATDVVTLQAPVADLSIENSHEIFQGNTEGSNWDGLFYGMVGVDRSLTTSERQNLESYLASKSGVTL